MDISKQIDNLKFSDGVKSVSDVKCENDANNYVNDTSVELLWAMKAHKHAEVYMKLLKAVDSSKVKLTKYDDLIYRMFKRDFNDINVEYLDEDMFKSKLAKEKWRPFCEDFKGKIESYNFGTLIRKNVHEDYSEENSFLTTRIQFLAVEIVRNRHGLNSFFKTVTETQNKLQQLLEENSSVSWRQKYLRKGTQEYKVDHKKKTPKRSIDREIKASRSKKLYKLLS